MSVLNSLLWHFRIHRVSIVCFAVCAILFALTISFVAGGRKIERGDVDSVFETEAQSFRLVVLLQPDDDEDEEDEEEEEADPFTPWRTTEAKVLGARRFVLKQQFQIEVDRVNGVCELEPKQLKKLRVASKGGVKKALKDWRKLTLQRFGMGNRNGANDDDREPVEEKVYTDASEIDQQTLQLASNAYTSSVKEETTANNEFWKRTLRSTLSKEQMEVWEKFVTRQREIKREAMADAAIEKMNFEFGLTPEQKEKFIEVVKPEMLKAKLDLVESVGRHYENHLYLYYASKVKKSKLKEVLTKPQMAQWGVVVSTAKQYASWFEDRPVVVRQRRNVNVWARAGFGLDAFFESAGSFADWIIDFGNRLFKSVK